MSGGWRERLIQGPNGGGGAGGRAPDRRTDGDEIRPRPRQIPGGFGLDIDLHISLPGLDQADAQSLVEAAHQVCPYSNATRGNIDVTLIVA